MFISDIRVVKPNLLTAIFRANDVIAEREEVTTIRRISSGESTTADYYRLALQYKDFKTQRHAPDKIFLKITRSNLPETMIRREVYFYDIVLRLLLRKYNADELHTPLCHDAYYDDMSGRSHIILDDIGDEYKPSRDKTPPSQRHRDHVMDAIARVHAYWWESEKLSDLAPMPGEDLLAEALDKCQKNLEMMRKFPGSAFMPARHKDMLKTLAEKIPDKRKERLIAGKGLTVTHGDLNPANLLYSHQGSRIIDWQRWQIAAGTDDLAYMMVFFWPDHLRQFQENRMLRRYYQTLTQLGISGYSWSDLEYDYLASVAHWITSMLAGWTQQKHVSGYWKHAEKALDAFDKMNGMAIFS